MQYIPTILGFIVLGLVILYFIKKKSKTVTPQPAGISEDDQQFLETSVPFYQELNREDRELFEQKMVSFLSSVRITGVKTELTHNDNLLVAAGAVIPIFRFSGWQYLNLHEVLVYPNTFSRNYELDGEDLNVLGMVGEGALQNVMVLSQPALRQGFANRKKPTNTAIHEFVHLLDKGDGATDGLPENLIPADAIEPWLRWMHREIARIKHNQSDIDVYGATNEAEFFAVVSEYFFEKPEQFQQKHPELYELLGKIFKLPAKNE
jgi:MtfA peptidase